MITYNSSEKNKSYGEWRKNFEKAVNLSKESVECRDLLTTRLYRDAINFFAEVDKTRQNQPLSEGIARLAAIIGVDLEKTKEDKQSYKEYFKRQFQCQIYLAGHVHKEKTDNMKHESSSFDDIEDFMIYVGGVFNKEDKFFIKLINADMEVSSDSDSEN